MKRPVSVQFGLFGGANEIVGVHTVSAHTRVLEDGSEVVVPEHVRWNRGRKPKNTGSRARARKAPKTSKRTGAGGNLALAGQMMLLDLLAEHPPEE